VAVLLLLLLLLWLFGRSLMDGNRVRRSPSRFRLPQTSKIVDAEVDHDVFYSRRTPAKFRGGV